MGLSLTRKKNQSILIGDDIEIIFRKITDSQVNVIICAPKNVTILRNEIHEKLAKNGDLDAFKQREK